MNPALALTLACGLALQAAPGKSGMHFPNDLAVTLAKGDGRVGTYVSTPKGFATSSYWIEGPTGLVIIDTQFLPSAAEELITWAEKVTGKKTVLAVVLHPNPDKFNGVEVFQKHGVKVITSAQVMAAIPKVHELRLTWFYDRFKPDYPQKAPVLQSFGDKTTEVEAGGVKLKLHVLGVGCSEAHVVAQFEDHIFPGDLVTNGFHSWLEIGRTDEWLKRMDELQAMDPAYVHPGRGPSGGPELLEREKAYLEKVRRIVAEAKPRLPYKEEELEPIAKRIFAEYPGYKYTRFVENGLAAEYENQARQAAARKPAAPAPAAPAGK